MQVLEPLRTILLPVFGMTKTEEISPDATLVTDLGADSLDFIEISCLVEREFKVVIKTNAMISQAFGIDPEALFVDGLLTDEGERLVRAHLGGPPERFRAGMAKAQLFSVLTVRDLARIIAASLPAQTADVQG